MASSVDGGEKALKTRPTKPALSALLIACPSDRARVRLLKEVLSLADDEFGAMSKRASEATEVAMVLRSLVRLKYGNLDRDVNHILADAAKVLGP